MKFYTSSFTPRPVRLSADIRSWAWESLHGKYGDEALKNGCVTLDDIDNFDNMTDIQKYDAAIRRIVSEAPVRICDMERISGSATLGMAISHLLPVTRNGESIFPSVSHLTIDYEKTLKYGIDSYSVEIEERLKDEMLTEKQKEFLHSLQNTIASMRIWHQRYLAATKDIKPEIYQNLSQVPFKPARNFYEAVQSIWFVFSFVRLCGNWPGIGRIDQLLGGYLKHDLKTGAITLETAREILASFFIKGCEWVQSHTPEGSGDAQHYQNIVLSGIDQDGNEVTNEVTYLVLDIIEELAISDFPISVRLNSRSPERLLRKIAKVIRHGGGVVAVYNEELVIRSLLKNGYPLKEARGFANDGCWETQIPGRTNFTYCPFDSLQILNTTLGLYSNDPAPDYHSVEEIYQDFCARMKKQIYDIYRLSISDQYQKHGDKWGFSGNVLPTSVISLFEEGCIENAASYYDIGPTYTVRSPHIGGAPDVANSLYAIEKIVFEQKLVTFPELVDILRNNWEGHQDLRLFAKNKFLYYGNDNDESDAYMTRLLNDFADMVDACAKEHADCPIKFIPGVSTFGRQIEWLPQRCAVAFGFRKGDILAANDSPTPGTDSAGATAMIKSYCKADLEKQTCGAALDIKIFPETLKGEDGIQALKALLRGIVALNGYFVQIDVVDAQTLLAAREDPEAYKTLSVRVSGWNARFVTLNKQWQDMIIERTTQGM